MSELRTRVVLCGALRVEIDGRDITAQLPGGQPGAARLLPAGAARAAPPTATSSSRCSGPSAAPKAPGAALRPVLSRLRRALAPATLEGRERLVLALPEPVWFDPEAAAQALADARAAAQEHRWAAVREQAGVAAAILRPGLLTRSRWRAAGCDCAARWPSSWCPTASARSRPAGDSPGRRSASTRRPRRRRSSRRRRSRIPGLDAAVEVGGSLPELHARLGEFAVAEPLATWTARHGEARRAIVARVITCHLRYEIDAREIDAFERFARAWMELVERHGGTHHGYFLPSEGASDIAYALFSFPSLADYERYRARFGVDPDFVAADRIRDESGCVLRYERSFLRPLLPGDA